MGSLTSHCSVKTSVKSVVTGRVDIRMYAHVCGCKSAVVLDITGAHFAVRRVDGNPIQPQATPHQTLSDGEMV